MGFYRVKRWETAIRVASLPAEPLTPEQRRHDEQVRRNIEAAFGFMDLGPDDDDHAHASRRAAAAPADASANAAGAATGGGGNENLQRRAEDEEPMTEAELRLTRTLRAAGLI